MHREFVLEEFFDETRKRLVAAGLRHVYSHTTDSSRWPPTRYPFRETRVTQLIFYRYAPRQIITLSCKETGHPEPYGRKWSLIIQFRPDRDSAAARGRAVREAMFRQFGLRPKADDVLLTGAGTLDMPWQNHLPLKNPVWWCLYKCEKLLLPAGIAGNILTILARLAPCAAGVPVPPFDVSGFPPLEFFGGLEGFWNRFPFEEFERNVAEGPISGVFAGPVRRADLEEYWRMHDRIRPKKRKVQALLL